MTKYNLFLFVFIISIIASISFIALYLQDVFAYVLHHRSYDKNNAFEIIHSLFRAPVIILLSLMIISNLLYRIMGIVWVAKNNMVKEGEKILWILGFVFMGFLTAIVFLVLAKAKKIVV